MTGIWTTTDLMALGLVAFDAPPNGTSRGKRRMKTTSKSLSTVIAGRVVKLDIDSIVDGDQQQTTVSAVVGDHEYSVRYEGERKNVYSIIYEEAQDFIDQIRDALRKGAGPVDDRGPIPTRPISKRER
jgi:hypothetical protein